MPSRALNQAGLDRLSKLDPHLAKVAWASYHEAQTKASDSPHYVILGECYRSPERQAWLYTQGRTRPGRKVTNAKPWESAHVFGAAFHLVCLVHPVRGPWLPAEHPLWMQVGLICEARGLEWGGRWREPKDFAHYELNRWRDGRHEKIAEVRREWEARCTST